MHKPIGVLPHWAGYVMSIIYTIGVLPHWAGYVMSIIYTINIHINIQSPKRLTNTTTTNVPMQGGGLHSAKFKVTVPKWTLGKKPSRHLIFFFKFFCLQGKNQVYDHLAKLYLTVCKKCFKLQVSSSSQS